MISHQLLFVDPAQEIGRGLAGGGVHPHVERSVVPEGEPALGAVELWRRDAEVDQKAVDRDHPQPIEHRPRLGEPGVDQGHAVAERLQGETRRLERVGVAVDPDQLPVRGRALQHGARMSAEPHGPVAVPSRWLRVEPGEHLIQQDGKVRRALLPRYVIAS